MYGEDTDQYPLIFLLLYKKQSLQIRHEFDLNQYPDKASVLRAITETQYLTGLTRTGAAIQHMVKEGFSERRGARWEFFVTCILDEKDNRKTRQITAPARMMSHV